MESLVKDLILNHLLHSSNTYRNYNERDDVHNNSSFTICLLAFAIT